ncbi:MAG: heme exporter protein CcmB [Bacteroidota bacterium]
MLREILTLLKKELMMEWKQKYAFNGLIMYVLCMVVVISLAFVNKLNPLTWNIIYWIIMLFVAINSVAKSFLSESTGQSLYLYSVVSPTSLIISKLIYNSLLLVIVAMVALLSYSFLSEVQVANVPLMLGIVSLGSMALSANLTLVTAIAAKAANRGTLMAVLSFPLMVPVLLVLIRLSNYAVQGLEGNFSYDSLGLLLGITFTMSALSVILFPFVWRD